MASGGILREDIFVISLKELQQEKNCLEQKLTELRNKRRKMEVVLETVNAKHAQTRDTNLKMIETLKVAQHKVLQTQTQADSFENSNREKRNRIDDLNEKIEAEKQNQLKEIKTFESNLREITTNLKESKQFYKEENLETQITAANQKIGSVDEEVAKSQGEISELEGQVNKLSLDESGGGDSSLFGVPIEDRKHIWQMLKDENNSSIRCLNNLESNLKDLASRLQVAQS